MSEVENESGNRIHISLPPVVLGGLFLAMFSAGGSVVGFVSPQLDRAALVSCVDGSEAALDIGRRVIDVVGDQSAELNHIRDAIRATNERITDSERETAKSLDRLDQQSLRRHQFQDERLDLMERQLDALD